MKACPESPARRPPRQRAAAPHTSCPQLPGPPPKPFGPHHCPAFHHAMWAALLNHTADRFPIARMASAPRRQPTLPVLWLFLS